MSAVRLSVASSLLWLLLSIPAAAQVSQTARYEVEHKSIDYDYTVVSMNNRGVAMIHQLDKYERGDHFWEIVLLDSALQKIWTKEMPLNQQMVLIGYEFTDSSLYYLFRKGSNDTGGLHLVRVDIEAFTVTEYEIEPQLDFRLTHFSVVGKSALLGGYVSNLPAVFLHDMENHRSKVTPGFFVKNTQMIDLRTNRNGTFNALMVDRSSTEKKRLTIRTMDESGAVIIDDEIEIDADKTILTGITSTLVRDELIVAGTWGSFNSKTALGVYTVVVDPFVKHDIRYYSFAELGKFLDYYVPKRANRLRAKTARRKKAGKLPAYSLFVNAVRLGETEEGFILLSEVYSTSGGNNYNSSYGPYANPYGYGNYSPYGYGYSPYYNRYSPYNNAGANHRTDVSIRFASLALFDAEGKLLEDTGQKIDDLKLSVLDQASDFVASRHRFIQVHRKEKDLYITTTERGEDEKPSQEKQPVKLKSPNDVLRNEATDEGSLRHWFGNTLFMYGYESIKGPEAGHRRVFYVNKITVHP